MNLRVLSLAELEAAEAALWYDRQRAGLGDEFLADFEHALDRIRDAPETLARLKYYSGSLEVRRCAFDRFPYLAIFLRRSDELLVVAVSHVRRRPLYWLARLP